MMSKQLFVPVNGPFICSCLGLICLNLMRFTCFWTFKALEFATAVEKLLYTALKCSTAEEKNVYTALEFAIVAEEIL